MEDPGLAALVATGQHKYAISSAISQKQCAHLLKVAGAPGEWQGAYLFALAPVVALSGLDVGLAVDARPRMRVLVLVLLFLVPGVEVAPALLASVRCADRQRRSGQAQAPFTAPQRQQAVQHDCSPSKGHPFTARLEAALST